MTAFLTEAFWAVVPGVIVGVFLGVWNRRQAKRQALLDQRRAQQEKRAQQREAIADEGELVKVSLLVAAASLSYAVAVAVRRGKPNGEIEEGIEVYKEAIGKFRDYERRVLSKGAGL